jgi:hypothetical protein
VKIPSRQRPLPTHCPCGAPAVLQLWEAPISLCYLHARDWLGSTEKVGCVKTPGGNPGRDGTPADLDPGAVDAAIEHFVRRIAKVSFWEKVKRWFFRR